MILWVERDCLVRVDTLPREASTDVVLCVRIHTIFSRCRTQLHHRLIVHRGCTAEIQRLGNIWSLFFRDPDGMELEVCAYASPED